MKIIKRLLQVTILAFVASVIAVEFFPKPTADALISIKRVIGGLDKHTMQLADGTTIVYLQSKKSDKPVMLLIHGFGADKDNYNEIAPYLRTKYQLVVPDLAGFGESSKNPLADYTTKAQAVRLNEFMQKLGFNKFYMAGSSMGGATAINYAALYPNQVQALLLLSPAGVKTAPQSELTSIIQKTSTNPLIINTPSDMQKLVAFTMSKPPLAPNFVLETMAQSRIDNNKLEHIIFKQINAEQGVEPILANIKAPTFVVWGKQDRALHYGGAEILKQGIPNAQVEILSGIGHLPHMEVPRKVAADIKSFIALHVQ